MYFGLHLTDSTNVDSLGAFIYKKFKIYAVKTKI